MTLLDLYEDLFQKLCDLNRASRAQAQPDYEQVRSDLMDLLEKPGKVAATDVRLLNQTRELELPMICYVDNFVCGSGLSFAGRWADNRLAVQLKNEQAGDDRFLGALEKDLNDTSEEVRERLAIYYTCLGLGFSGMSPSETNNAVNRMHQRVKAFMNVDLTRKVTEEVYKHTNTQILNEPPSKWLMRLTVLFIFLGVVALIIYSGLYVNASSKAGRYIEQTLTNVTTTAK